MNKIVTVLLGVTLSTQMLHAADVVVPIKDTTTNKVLGDVVFSQSTYGVLVKPNLSGLPQGLHGLHLHQHASCDDHGNSAGAHFDPQQSNSHQGPYGAGHLGDLPVLYVNADGKADTPTLAPRLKITDLKGLSLMIHANGDNYSDTPALGGGGAREACGVIL